MRVADVPSGVSLGILAAALIVLHGPAHAQDFNITNLASDGFVPAATIDPQLVNPWGVAYGPTGPFWVSDNNSGLSTLYNGAGTKIPLTVVIAPPAGQSSPAAPTGVVFNGSSTNFIVTSGGQSGAAAFIFDTEDGTISGWAPSVSLNNSILAVDNSNGGAGAVYKGLATGSVGGSPFLYAANFRAGDVEVYNSNFALVNTFTDPTVAAGFAPFNVQNLGGTLYVTFAKQDAAKHDDVAGPGNGYVDAFDLNGNFLRRIVSFGGNVDSPWGLDIAPASFGALAGDLMVGNFGSGTISLFSPAGVSEGDLLGFNGKPIVIGDLWALITGNGALGGSPNDVYFTAGIAQESHGLFGSLSAVPEPATWTLMLVGMGLLGANLRARAFRGGATAAGG